MEVLLYQNPYSKQKKRDYPGIQIHTCSILEHTTAPGWMQFYPVLKLHLLIPL